MPILLNRDFEIEKYRHDRESEKSLGLSGMHENFRPTTCQI